MRFTFDAWDEQYKKPFGAVRQGQSVEFSVQTDADAVRVVGLDSTLPMERSEEGFSLSFEPSKEKGLYFYTFEADFGAETRRFGKCADSGVACENGKSFQLTVHSNLPVPEWFKGKTMYQIYVDRFFKGREKDVVLRDHVLLHTSWGE